MADGDLMFGARLSSCRRLAGLSQEGLAKRAGLSVRTISNLERGRARWPHPDSVRRLADALGLRGRTREEFFAAAARQFPGGITARALTMAGDRPDEGEPARPGMQPTPRQLPAAVNCFAGRAEELAALDALLEETQSGARRTVLVISAIGGTAGVGKTALAVQWAHRAADRFPDGQLYVNLRGYDPGPPLAAGDALAGFLRALGVSGPDIPPEADERAARYRSLLAGKQVLVVLDNAGSADQVRPLLPGTGTCTVLVTSRDAMAGLAARDGATRLDLDPLPLQDAVALLRRLIGPRADADPEAAAELAGQCCRLPLALRVAAELAASRPALPLAALTAELADLRTRLDLLETGADPSAQVRTVFSWSCRHLDAQHARTFRLLGLHPGPHFDPYAAAALTGTPVVQARRALDTLSRAHLVSPACPGRYGMHDLLRGYASELAAAEDGRHAALTRLFDYYLHTAAAAMDTLFPAESHRRPRIPAPATPVPALADPAAARQWLDGERATLAAVAAHTAAHGWPGHATRLAATVSTYLRNGGHIPEALTIFGHALSAARRTGDRIAEAATLNDIGLAHRQLSRFHQAGDQLRQALTLFRQAGDLGGQARVLTNIGLVDTELDRYQQAARRYQQALALHQDTGDRFGQARTLGLLGLARQRQGYYQEAAGYHQQSLDLFRAIDDRDGQGWALARLGGIDLRLNRYQPAAGHFTQALSLFREMDEAAGQAEVLSLLGDAQLGLGRHQQATRSYEQALAISRKIADPILEADALNGLGSILCQAGDAATARAHHATALQLASQASSPRGQARAHACLARAWQASGDTHQARHHWQQALTRYTAIGTPEADQIRAEMTATDRQTATSNPDRRTTGERRQGCPP
jgi:tetratricopeptide (TPR) repeat protein/transcriptional regulator with XRE-family HTH domain